MTSIHPNCIIITIPTTEPNEKRLWLVKSLAAALRWNANCPAKKETDNDNQEQICELLEALATDK